MCVIKKIFLKAKKSIAHDKKDDKYYSSEKCEDQYIGTISICNCCGLTKWLNCSLNDKDDHNNKDKRNKLNTKLKEKPCEVILLILESPHKKEYDEHNHECIGPANGPTGCNIKNYLHIAINNHNSKNKIGINSGDYKIYLANAIQYQCSLGFPTKKYRDKMFEKMWKCLIVRNNLIKRIKQIKPKYIINCCTKGTSKNKEKDTLRYKVQKEINKEFKSNLLRSTHPFSWRKFANIETEKEWNLHHK